MPILTNGTKPASANKVNTKKLSHAMPIAHKSVKIRHFLPHGHVQTTHLNKKIFSAIVYIFQFPKQIIPHRSIFLGVTAENFSV